ncbi:MAG: hypothetical protein ABID61_05005 [Candidatus Micrarchaeota archaeon]
MNDFRKIFAERGYSLFESDSVENAIINAIKQKELRYLYGIPLVIENSEIDFEELIALSKKEKLFPELMDILSITAKIISDKKIRKSILSILKSKKIKRFFDVKEFKDIYLQYTNIKTTEFGSRLHFNLSILFAPKQIHILYKLKSGKRLNKTEKEYYSRTIKKKLMAIHELVNFSELFI